MNRTCFKPHLTIADDFASFAKLGASSIIDALEKAKSPLVILPTGNTPLGIYEVLSTNHVHRRDLWQNMRFLQLDEYAGLENDDPRLFKGWLSRIFLDKVALPQENRTAFISDAPNPADECARMEDILNRFGPADLCVLGIGTDGHLGMNMPGGSQDSPIHLAKLSPETIRINASYWGGDETSVPSHGYTLGLDYILQSKKILLLAQGKAKAGILRTALSGSISANVPASFLQTVPNVMVIADRAACPEPMR